MENLGKAKDANCGTNDNDVNDFQGRTRDITDEDSTTLPNHTSCINESNTKRKANEKSNENCIKSSNSEKNNHNSNTPNSPKNIVYSKDATPKSSPPPYTECVPASQTLDTQVSRAQRRISKGRVSFDLGSKNDSNTPQEERRRKISREMAVQTDKGPRVSFCFDEHPFFPEATPPDEKRERKLSGILINGSINGARPKTPSPRVSFSNEPSESLFHDSVERSEYESSLSQEPPKRQSRQRRSGVVHTPHMGMSEDTKFDVDESPHSDEKPKENDINIQIPDELDGEEATEDRTRKDSYSSELELGKINQCFRDDDDLDLLQRKVGRWTVGDYIGDSASEASQKEDDFHKSISTESIPMATQTDETLIRPKRTTNQLGTKSILKKTSKEFLPIQITDNTAPVIEKSNKKHNLATHVRKDSIALTSEKMGQIKELKRKYSGSKSVNPIWKRQKDFTKKYQLHLCVGALLGFLIIIVSVGWHFHGKASDFKKANQKIHIDPSVRKILVGKPLNADDLHGIIGAGLPRWQTPYHCLDEPETLDFVCLKWKDNAILRVQHYGDINRNCYNMTWTTLSESIYPEDCYDIASNVWYGPSNTTVRKWALSTENTFYFTSGNLGYYPSGTFESTADYAWISSKGGMIFVDKSNALFVKWNANNDGKVCIGAKYEGLFYGSHPDKLSHFKYTICNANNIIEALKYSHSFFPKIASEAPLDDLLRFPAYVGSTYSNLQGDRDDDIYDTLNLLNAHNLSCSTFVIDGKWENALGDFSFNNNTFQNASNTIKNIHSAGMLVTVEISPYVSYKSFNFDSAYKYDNFILGGASRVPGLVNTADSLSAVLDVNNNYSVAWIRSKKEELISMGVDSFHLRLSTKNWLPYKPYLQIDTLPGQVRERFVKVFAPGSSDSTNAIANAQDLNNFITVPTTLSSNFQNHTCIVGVIESALTLGVLGYPWVRIDGTFGFSEKFVAGNLPTISKDLYERWMQMSSFFPSFKYSIPPWRFGNESVSKAKSLALLHQTIIFPIIKSFKGNVHNRTAAIINPLWLVDPNDSVSHTISDEFLVGNSILVAPVLCENTVKRDIYIPKGIWSDPRTGGLVKGSHWLYDYHVDQGTVPYFIKKEVYGEDKR